MLLVSCDKCRKPIAQNTKVYVMRVVEVDVDKIRMVSVMPENRHPDFHLCAECMRLMSNLITYNADIKIRDVT